MIPEDKVTSLIVKLNKLTSLGQIQWEIMDVPRSILRGTDDHIPMFMVTNYKGQQFALYQHRYQSYDGERDRFFWNETLVLAILDPEDRLLWETHGYSAALLDLFETVRKKVANIEELLDDLLADDDEL